MNALKKFLLRLYDYYCNFFDLLFEDDEDYWGDDDYYNDEDEYYWDDDYYNDEDEYYWDD